MCVCVCVHVHVCVHGGEYTVYVRWEVRKSLCNKQNHCVTKSFNSTFPDPEPTAKKAKDLSLRTSVYSRYIYPLCLSAAFIPAVCAHATVVTTSVHLIMQQSLEPE